MANGPLYIRTRKYLQEVSGHYTHQNTPVHLILETKWGISKEESIVNGVKIRGLKATK